VRSLDGLRGLAALVVVMHHALLASAPRLAAVYAPGPGVTHTTLERLLAFTPLHIIWAGQEFVIVFFVLSGFVLTLPAARGRPLPAALYYPSRLTRLYLPVWGALAFAAVLHVAVAHRAVAGASFWLDAHSQPLGWSTLAREATLVTGAGDWAFTSVLWSLRWEVLFSLALPLLLWGLLRSRSRGGWLSLLTVLCALALLFHGASEYLLYLPTFGFGVAMAFALPFIQRLGALLARRGAGRVRAVEVATLALCACLLTADWWAPGERATALLIALGASLAVLAALVLPGTASVLRSRPMQWTGKRSYSLYLVHEPIVVALAFLVGGRPEALVFVALAFAVALPASAAFFLVVERPSHRLARALGLRSLRLAAHAHADRAAPVGAPVQAPADAG
jgi:peptidoglycan/LPS O-acetylase OafA/YrhL